MGVEDGAVIKFELAVDDAVAVAVADAVAAAAAATNCSQSMRMLFEEAVSVLAACCVVVVAKLSA